MLYLLEALALLLLSTGQAEIYVEKSNPYLDGTLEAQQTTLTPKDSAPMHANVFHPKLPGEYAVLYFIPGAVNGIIPSEFYSDFLHRIASHGFVVVAADAFWPASPATWFKATDTIDNHLENIAWLKQYLKNIISVNPLWDHFAFGCHSAGCDVTLSLMERAPTLAHSTMFLEPFSFHVKGAKIPNIPAYMYGTELASVAEPIPCTWYGVDYRTFFESWGCPKWLTEVKNFGHCDVLDQIPWEACSTAHFCKSIGTWDRIFPQYHNYVQGAVSAFLIGTLQDYSPSLIFIEDQKYIPLPMLQINQTLTC